MDERTTRKQRLAAAFRGRYQVLVRHRELG